jgi:hypothetical protein
MGIKTWSQRSQKYDLQMSYAFKYDLQMSYAFIHDMLGVLERRAIPLHWSFGCVMFSHDISYIN